MKSEDTRFETCTVNSVAYSIYINGEQVKDSETDDFHILTVI
jgi:hypothetical protein